MLNFLVVSFTFVVSLGVFRFANGYSTIAKTFMQIDDNVLKTCVNSASPIALSNGPYFDINLAMSRVSTILNDSFKPYWNSIDYELDFHVADAYFYRGQSYPTALTITLDARYLNSFEYNNSLNFRITKGAVL